MSESHDNPSENSADLLPVALAQEYLQVGDAAQLRFLLADLHAADAAALVQQLSAADRQALFALLKGYIDPEVLTYLDEQIREDLFESLSDTELAALLNHLESDDALDIIANLDEARQHTLLRAVPSRDRALYEESLSWPEASAGRLMRREVVTIPSFWTVGEIIDHMRNKKTETPVGFYNIIVVGSNHKPIGMIGLARLLRSVRSVPVGRIMDENFEAIPVDMEQEAVAHLFRQYGYIEMPVIDEAGRLVGTITIDDVLFILQEQYEDDILKLGGVSEDDFYADVAVTIRQRFSWLGLNLLTAILASIVIAFFDEALEEVIALAILMPIVASMGGNAGTQTLTVAVRALATGELTGNNALRIVYKEVLVGGLNGFIFAVIGAFMAWFWFGDLWIGLVIGLALVVNLLIGGFAGATIPLLLDRWGADPAVSSSVFLTTVTDVVGFFAFLGIGVLVLF